ncbi:MAG: DUF192 domain-containing protein [Candidatus Aenigmarchaeota archaeon]|nr:DUF192 domain-containing protein [Candidatus Aenigmarchaeota archaeon]
MEFKFLIIFALLAAAIILIFINKSELKYARVIVGNTSVKAEVADTALKQVKGLMFRKSLPENEGMLFIFDKEDYYGFWMMNTSIPLDIIWINKDMEIVHIEKNVQPCGILCPIYKSKEKAIYILEVNAGFVKKHGIEVGHFVEI